MPAGVEAGEAGTPNIAISPDGTRLAFVGGVGGLRRLYVRRLDEFEAKVLRGTETANVCFFSPDGRSLAFTPSDRTLRTVSLADGLVTTLVGDVDYAGGGGVWGSDDRITFTRAGELWQVPSRGGPPQRLTTLDNGNTHRSALARHQAETRRDRGGTQSHLLAERPLAVFP